MCFADSYGFYGYSSFGGFANGVGAAGPRGVPENAVPMAPMPAMPDSRVPQMASGAYGGTFSQAPMPLKKVTRVRQKFPESWIWADVRTWYI